MVSFSLRIKASVCRLTKLVPNWLQFRDGIIASGRNEGGGGAGGVNPPNVQRTLAFMLSRETLQNILDRKTPPQKKKCFTLFRTLFHSSVSSKISVYKDIHS